MRSHLYIWISVYYIVRSQIKIIIWIIIQLDILLCINQYLGISVLVRYIFLLKKNQVYFSPEIFFHLFNKLTKYTSFFVYICTDVRCSAYRNEKY